MIEQVIHNGSIKQGDGQFSGSCEQRMEKYRKDGNSRQGVEYICDIQSGTKLIWYTLEVFTQGFSLLLGMGVNYWAVMIRIMDWGVEDY